MDVPPVLSKLTPVDVTPRQHNALVWPVRADHIGCPTVLGEGVETAAEQTRDTNSHSCERPYAKAGQVWPTVPGVVGIRITRDSGTGVHIEDASALVGNDHDKIVAVVGTTQGSDSYQTSDRGG